MIPPEIREVQRTNARLSQLMTNLQGGVLVEDETRHITLVNQAFCDIFKIPALPESLIGADCSNSAETSKGMFREPEDFVTRVNTVLQDKQPVLNETLALADGRVLSRDYIPVFFDVEDNSQEYIGHLWHYRDITEEFHSHRRWERLLKFELVNREITRVFLQLDDIDDAVNQALATTGQLLDVSRVYVFRFRENDHVLDNTHEWCAHGVKPEIENLQGLPADELFPSFFPLMAEHDLIAPTHISELPDDLHGILEPQDIQSILWIPLRLNKRLEGMVGYDETRHAREWLPEEITMVRTIAESYARALERQQAEHMLIKARDEAVRTAQMRAQFVANMSHEIRTPMTGTLGMLELLLETQLDEIQREFALEAFNSSSRLLNIINDILDYSKLETGQVVLGIESLDVKAIVNEVKVTLLPQLKDKPVELETVIDPSLPYRVFGDATRIRQVLMNLAGNAVKFTQKGQVFIRVEVTRAIDDVVYLRFSVQDTGMGIAEDKINRIFDSFIQADGSTTRKFGGSGLGLSISKQLVELMGGHIFVESEVDEGSTFSFVLGLPIARLDGHANSTAADFAKLNILIIDDNRTARYVLTQQLENWGVQVKQVSQLKDYDQNAQRYTKFNVVFKRYMAWEKDEEIINQVAKLGHQIVLITERDPALHSDDIVCWQWPFDQSSLYNLLVQAVKIQQRVSKREQTSQKSTKSNTVKGRVLIADDYDMNVDLVKRGLSGIQIQVDSVDNGQKALEQLEKETYDLVLMDIQMPVLDGIEATKQIRNSSKPYRHVPIIALTASVMLDEQKRYLEMGINQIISKPFSIRELRETVLQWLEKTEPTHDRDAV
ncbi:response regulator [Phototrophicus methaneseepsis]|uniref:Circadian input-output histidine kinase CikA n=1 Tax=Phototrophicus methaneseepsis TaxID=2710758 RepID=A0A7S8EDG3_9CHLR|nr:response regulator [Phototrophicus methaneseepsis]QPC84952.1 response regulator [Phototrophicus methaneseepsis]